MGMHQSVYVGAYFVAPHVEVDDLSTTFSCSAQCGARGLNRTMKFCSQCGAPVAPVKSGKKVLRSFRPEQLNEAFEGMVFTPETAAGRWQSVLLPNHRGDFGLTLSSESGTCPDTVKPVDPDFFANAERALREHYAELIEAAETAGVKLEVQTGFFIYWS